MVIIRNADSFAGFVTLGDRMYAFEITPHLSQWLFNLDWKLQKLLGDSLNNFLQCNEFSDPTQFHDNFQTFIKEKLGEPKECEKWLQNPLKTCALVKNLKEEIKNVKDVIKNLDIEKGIVEIEVRDQQLRIHKSIIKLSQSYLQEPIHIISHDLPLQKANIFQANSDLDTVFSITEFCDKFTQLITHFQKFWDAMALIDSQCYVLDPPNPTFKNIYRRIKLKDTLSVVLTFNPYLGEQRPFIKLVGCQSDVNYYRNILQNSLENELWDCDEDVLYNISNVLQVTLPSKSITEDKEISDLAEPGECAICFTWRLKEEIPNEVCERPTCKSMYHSTCLFTYLSSLPRNRDYFGKIQGECPNCDEIISCTVPKFMN